MRKRFEVKITTSAELLRLYKKWTNDIENRLDGLRILKYGKHSVLTIFYSAKLIHLFFSRFSVIAFKEFNVLRSSPHMQWSLFQSRRGIRLWLDLFPSIILRCTEEYGIQQERLVLVIFLQSLPTEAAVFFMQNDLVCFALKIAIDTNDFDILTSMRRILRSLWQKFCYIYRDLLIPLLGIRFRFWKKVEKRCGIRDYSCSRAW